MLYIFPSTFSHYFNRREVSINGCPPPAPAIRNIECEKGKFGTFQHFLLFFFVSNQFFSPPLYLNFLSRYWRLTLVVQRSCIAVILSTIGKRAKEINPSLSSNWDIHRLRANHRSWSQSSQFSGKKQKNYINQSTVLQPLQLLASIKENFFSFPSFLSYSKNDCSLSRHQRRFTFFFLWKNPFPSIFCYRQLTCGVYHFYRWMQIKCLVLHHTPNVNSAFVYYGIASSRNRIITSHQFKINDRLFYY